MNRIIILFALCLLSVAVDFLQPASSPANTPRCIHLQALEPGPAEQMYFYSASAHVEELLAIRKQLIAQGARKVNCFPPFVVACELPSTVDYNVYLARSDIVALREHEIKSSGSIEFINSPQWVKQCYRAARNISFDEPDGIQRPPVSDNYRVPPMELNHLPAGRLSPSALTQEDERNVDQNSEFLLGDILVQVVYPESQGPAENWTDAALSGAASGVTAALLYFQETYSRVPIHFIVRSIPRAFTALEPVSYTREEKEIWITNVMYNLGYEGDQTEYIDLIHEFNNDWRIQWNTDWVFTAFVVNSANDSDHRFGPQARYVGFSELGGPYLAVPFPAGYEGTVPFRQAFIYEMGHVFWAHYENPGGASCEDRSGYLSYKNWNKTVKYGELGVEGCTITKRPAPCIMNIEDVYEFGYDGSPCSYTDGMIGLIDKNGNNIPDAVDAPPVVVFEPARLETTFVPEFQMSFQVISSGIQNKNPLQDPASRLSYALPVKDVALMVNSVGPFYLFPLDGESDETTEEFATELTSLIPGITTVEVSARNTIGATSKWFSKHFYYVGLTYKHFQFDFSNEGIGISWNMMGETFDAQFDLHRIDPGDDSVDEVVISDVQPSKLPDGYFLPFRCCDTEVVPGQKYSYYVEGTFSVNYRGEELTITKKSNAFEVYASLKMTKNHILSAPSPNPFRGQTWISIAVPPSYTGVEVQAPHMNKDSGGLSRAPSVEQLVPTWVKAIIYDALGHRVKDLYHERVYSTTLTLPWNGTNNNNEKVPSGVYFLRVEAGPYSQVQKITVLR